MKESCFRLAQQNRWTGVSVFEKGQQERWKQNFGLPALIDGWGLLAAVGGEGFWVLCWERVLGLMSRAFTEGSKGAVAHMLGIASSGISGNDEVPSHTPREPCTV